MNIQGLTKLALLSTFLCMVSCSDRPKNVPSDSDMVKVMADIEVAQAYIQNKGYKENTPENRERILEYVLKKNGMAREDFDSTLAWYGRHIDKYDDLYAKVDKELAKRESKVSGNKEELLSNDLWPYQRHLIISSKSSTDNLTFNVPTEEVKEGDILTWKFRMNIPADGTALLGVKYPGGKVAYVNQTIHGNNMELTLQTDSALKAREIFGNIRVKGNNSFVGIDSLTIYAAPFDSTMYYRIHSLRNFYGPVSKVRKEEKKDSLTIEKDSIQVAKK